MESAPTLLGLPVGSLTLPSQYFLAMLGIFGSFALPGLCHVILTRNYQFTESVFLTFTQFLVVALSCFSWLSRLFRSHRRLSVTFGTYFGIALCMAVSMALDNFAALRLSHETEVLFKSPKLIPVMVCNIVLLRRHLKLSEIVTVCVIVSGFVGMALGDFYQKSNFDLYGIVAVFVSLLLEAVVANLEEKLIRDCQAPVSEVMSMIFGIGSAITMAAAVAKGEMVTAIRRIANEPKSLLYLGVYAVMGAIGLHFVFFSQSVFGSLQTVLFTSFRKALNAVYSLVLVREMRFTSWHGVSLVILASGMAANFWLRMSDTKKEEEVMSADIEEADDEMSNDPMDDDYMDDSEMEFVTV